MYKRKPTIINELTLPADIVDWIDAEVRTHSADYVIDRSVVIESVLRDHIDKASRASSGGQKRGRKARQNGSGAQPTA